MDDGPSCRRSTEPRGVTRVEWLDPRSLLAVAERRWLADQSAAALSALAGADDRARGGEVRVRVVDDAEMDAAHRQYSGLPGTTDVLTFDLREDPAGLLDTDLLVCVDEAARQGARHGHDRARELLLYMVHGTLHCLGEDDATDDAAERMHAREDAVLTSIGVGATFAVASAAGAASPEARAC